MKGDQKYLIFVLIGMVFILLLMGTFWLGSYFGRTGMRMDFDLMGRDHMMSSNRDSRHGVLGVIESISGSSLEIKDRRGNAIKVLIDKETSFSKMMGASSAADLVRGEEVLVIGEPGKDGEVQARAIKVLLRRSFESSGSANFGKRGV